MKITELIKNNKILIIIVIASLLLILIPLYRQPIICNDEVLTRFWAGQGFEVFWNHYMDTYTSQGRLLGAPIATVDLFLGFVSQDISMYKIGQMLMLLMCSLLFGVFIKTCFKNTCFALLCSISFLLFLPITFEHTPPNAFISLVTIPTSFLLISLTVFIKYLENGLKKNLAISVFIFFICCVCYEFFITMILLYFSLTFVYKYDNVGNKRKLAIVSTVIAAIAYLILYLTSAVLFTSHYEGTTFANPIDLLNSISIVFTLFFASVPVYYLNSPKYHWLMSTAGEIDLIPILVRVSLLFTLYMILIILLKKKSDKNDEQALGSPMVILLGLMVATLPFTPISISSMYQHMVGEQGFLALPATFLAYYGIVFVICYIIWRIVKNKNSVHYWITLIVALFILVVPMQMTNDIYCKMQEDDYGQYILIEEFVESDGLFQIGGTSYKSPDLYTPHHILSVSDGYWTTYSQVYGNSITILSAEPEDLDDDRIYFENGHLFEVWHDGNLTLMSKNQLPDRIEVIKIGQEKITVSTVDEKLSSDGWYVYACIIE